mmetsp:Transcript_21837/g.62219  ORF Transcript_21837/g.62219 Transcript_21837/m.62219 type:complete len:216 (-) Transcript_21837:18-665(-)
MPQTMWTEVTSDTMLLAMAMATVMMVQAIILRGTAPMRAMTVILQVITMEPMPTEMTGTGTPWWRTKECRDTDTQVQEMQPRRMLRTQMRPNMATQCPTTANMQPTMATMQRHTTCFRTQAWPMAETVAAAGEETKREALEDSMTVAEDGEAMAMTLTAAGTTATSFRSLACCWVACCPAAVVTMTSEDCNIDLDYHRVQETASLMELKLSLLLA